MVAESGLDESNVEMRVRNEIAEAILKLRSQKG